MNGSKQKDQLNTVLLDARKELHGLQASLRKDNVNYSDILNQLSETTDKYQSEAESLLNERYSDSTVMPLQATLNININAPNTNPRHRGLSQKDDKKTLIQQIRATSPQEIHPFKTNRAMDLRIKSTVRPIHISKGRSLSSKQVVPPLKNYEYDGTQNALELTEKGLINETDDLQSILPGIDTTASSTQNFNAPFFPNIQIDISGAARSYRLKKEQRQRQLDEFNSQLENVLNTSPSNTLTDPLITTTPSNEKVQEEHPPTSPTTKEKEKDTEKEDTKISGPRVYEDLQDEFAYQTLLVVRGKIARDTPDFESFQRTNQKNWEKISQVMDAIEQFCEMFDIQFAEINGRKLGEASRLNLITFDDVYSCLVNVDEFIDKKRNDAAKVIQKNVRIFLKKKKENELKKLSKAAYKIQSTFRNYLRRQTLSERYEDHTKELLEKATFLTETFKVDTTMNDLLYNDVVSIHVLTSIQDITRTFSLIYKNMEIILIVTELPPPHIWEEMVDFFAQSGISDVNERIHFILLREMNSGDSISHRLQCDMKSLTKIQRILKGRLCYIVPHSDWFSEQRLSSDLKVPIFGIVDTTDYQSRAAIKNIFIEAQIPTPISTKECTNVVDLLEEVSQIISNHQEIDRYIIRYGFSQNEKSIAYFDATQNIRYIASILNKKCRKSRNDDKDYEISDFIKEVRQELKCNGCTVNSFFKMIEQVGAIAEAVPPVIRSFPSVSLMLSGDKKISVIGTFDRMNYSPFHFTCSMIPSISVDSQELISRAKQAASVLIKRGIIGYITVDFISFDVGNGIQFVGFDIRTNSYPSILYTAYLTLCADFNEKTGKMVLLKNVCDASEDAQRYCVIQNCVSHPGMALIGMNDIKKACFAEGLFFDLLKRTGFKFIFFDSPSNGKGFTLMSANTANTAISLMIRSYAFLLKYFGMKAGTDSNSSLVNGCISMREYKKRIYPDP